MLTHYTESPSWADFLKVVLGLELQPLASLHPGPVQRNPIHTENPGIDHLKYP